MNIERFSLIGRSQRVKIEAVFALTLRACGGETNAHGPDVENLLMHGEFPVQLKTAKFLFHQIAGNRATNTIKHPPSYFVSLVSHFAKRRIASPRSNFSNTIQISVRHCFERTIAGRPVIIEVTWVADKRWRAHIVRIPGVPTAMMPFYGETPDEAATHLVDWLDQAHHQANTV